MWHITDDPLSTYSAQGKGLGNWSRAYEYASALVSQMIVDEKVSVTSGQTTTTNGCNGMIPGVQRLGFPGICVNDGPSGLHGVEAVNGYAAGVTVAAAWNKELAHARGYHMGLEAKRRGGNNLGLHIVWDQFY